MSAGPDPRTSRPSPPASPVALAPAAEEGDRFAQQRRRLAALAVSLAQSLDPAAVAARILDAACDVLGAPQGWVAVVTADGQAAEILHARGYEPEVVAPWAQVPLSAATPMTAAIREGRAYVHRSRLERHAAWPALAGSASGAATEASAVVPMTFEGVTTGALAVAFHVERDFDEADAWYLESLAGQAAQALERARLFAALRDREERMRFALAASGTGTWDWDVPANRIEWSDEISRIHGTPPGWSPPTFDEYAALIHDDDRERAVGAIRAAVEDGARYDEEFRIVRPDGTVRWVHGVASVRRDEAGRPVHMTGTATDITPRREAEAERDRVLEAEREAARLRDAFIGVVSHELRTPITTIFGGTRVLARRWRHMPEEARDDILADVVEEADRLYRLVEDLLVLTRVERGVLDIGDEPVHLGRLVERVLGSERTRWPDVRFEVSIPAGLPSVAGEDTYLEQVLRNLAGNAAKYGGPGTTVTVAADASRDAVRLIVADEGPGVDDDEHDALFELFYRSPAVAAKAPGAGIGLFVCRQLVAAMGGTITAHRRAEGGAAFTVTLRRYEDDESG
ncbi:MAG TPA: ATP-binding protein [Candidatus Limnocylindrales bacterium]|nr:ATP-binding protein [Candidatus Limnocylindrales bacterium]